MKATGAKVSEGERKAMHRKLGAIYFIEIAPAGS
jgi:hypothetical protein